MHDRILTALVGASLLQMAGCPAEEDNGATAGATNPTGTDDDEGDTEDPSDPSTSGASQTTGMPPDPSDTDASDTEDPQTTTSPSTTQGGFISDPDGNSVSIECSVWDQDCPEGEKCMPWANDGGNSWNATRCSPVNPDAGQPGDPCTVEGSGVSGVDDCDVASMCWGVDPETNMGTCVAFCMGSENNPLCDDPMTACSITNEGTLVLCLPTCDPLLQNCMDGEACWGVDDDFVCLPDAGGETGAYGDACEFLNVCDPGLFCANPDVVPGCASAGCCSEFCDLADPMAGANCAGASGGQMCIPWFEKGASPPGYEDVGACAIPA